MCYMGLSCALPLLCSGFCLLRSSKAILICKVGYLDCIKWPVTASELWDSSSGARNSSLYALVVRRGWCLLHVMQASLCVFMMFSVITKSLIFCKNALNISMCDKCQNKVTSSCGIVWFYGKDVVVNKSM